MVDDVLDLEAESKGIAEFLVFGHKGWRRWPWYSARHRAIWRAVGQANLIADVQAEVWTALLHGATREEAMAAAWENVGKDLRREFSTEYRRGKQVVSYEELTEHHHRRLSQGPTPKWVRLALQATTQDDVVGADVAADLSWVWDMLEEHATESEIRALEALVEHGSYGNAAKALGMSRGGVSSAVFRLRKKLEAEGYGVPN